MKLYHRQTKKAGYAFRFYSRQQELDILTGEVLNAHRDCRPQDGVSQVALFLLQFQDLLLNSAPADQAVGKDMLGLPDAVRPVDGLGLDGGVPPGIER